MNPQKGWAAAAPPPISFGDGYWTYVSLLNIQYNYSITLETKSRKRHMGTYTFGMLGTSRNIKKGALGALLYMPLGPPVT